MLLLMRRYLAWSLVHLHDKLRVEYVVRAWPVLRYPRKEVKRLARNRHRVLRGRAAGMQAGIQIHAPIQAGRQVGRKAYKAGRHTGRHKGRHTGNHTGRQAGRQAGRPGRQATGNRQPAASAVQCSAGRVHACTGGAEREGKRKGRREGGRRVSEKGSTEGDTNKPMEMRAGQGIEAAAVCVYRVCAGLHAR